MKKRSKKDKCYFEVGEAMSMNDCRCFINIETMEVEIHPSEDFFSFGDEEDTAQEAIENPDRFLLLGHIHSSDAFKVMESFTENVTDKNLKVRLSQALDGKKPFANFRTVIDNSSEREDWFDFKGEAYAVIAKQWLEENAGKELFEKIDKLPSVYFEE